MAGRTVSMRGEGRVGLLVALILVGGVIFTAVKFVPVYIAAYDMRDMVRGEASRATLKTDDQVLKAILDKAAELDLPITKKSVQMSRTQSKFRIKVQFEVPIDLAVTTYVYKYDQSEETPLF